MLFIFKCRNRCHNRQTAGSRHGASSSKRCQKLRARCGKTETHTGHGVDFGEGLCHNQIVFFRDQLHHGFGASRCCRKIEIRFINDNEHVLRHLSDECFHIRRFFRHTRRISRIAYDDDFCLFGDGIQHTGKILVQSLFDRNHHAFCSVPERHHRVLHVGNRAHDDLIPHPQKRIGNAV